MRRSAPALTAAALGVLLLVDILRVWLPSIITIFGQAASTPAELMGAFALLWFVLPLGAPPLFRLLGAGRFTLVAAVTLVGCRLLLPATPGGPAQLYLASAGLLAGLVWLAGLATTAPVAVPGLVVGLAATTVLHTALGTHDLVWRGGVDLLVGVPVAVAFLVAQVRARDADPVGSARPWLLVGPALLLWGMLAGSPALAATGASYLAGAAAGFDRVAVPPPGGPLAVTVLVAGAVGLFLATGLGPVRQRGLRWLYPVALLAGTGLFALNQPLALPFAILFAAAGLGGCLALANAVATVSVVDDAIGGAGGTDGACDADSAAAGAEADSAGAGADSAGAGADSGGGNVGPPLGGAETVGNRRGYAALGGTVVFVVGAIGYYAAYDIGYPNSAIPLLVALFVAVVAIRGPVGVGGAVGVGAAKRGAVGVGAAPVVPESAGGGVRAPLRSWRRTTVISGTALAVVAGLLTPPAADAAEDADRDRVRLVAYNIRMGFGLDGRFDLDGLAGTIAGQRPDVVLLSEVDRAWLLNGGHDTLALLAGRLGMRYTFAPAADPVWGDAVLTSLPVESAGTVVLPRLGAPTGAQALAVVLRVGDGELVVVSTHFQPPPDDGPLDQARTAARYAVELAAGRPLVLAGDLNTQPGEPAFQALLDAGLVDAFAADRPLPTSPADHPVEQIDHVFVAGGLGASEVAAVPGTASDHLAVAVTLTLPR
ncbi:endonuclease/exonuclease/phosphatase family protein [Micromonospora sp. NBC_01699]|uniref:endonuclease/exonuclease/phosphatase family protein n=1 Tax=Micromonospora sp. NBC_01699 TaxID=2975984 RepID=UPI002E33DE06|nr:endonuclease/exonuclease/phosphatase family protein [Micromonospora sp. NBC_01699]